MATPDYALTETLSENNIRYFFISTGYADIVKAVDYSYAGDLHDRKVYNLGFGDYDIVSDSINDLQTSNNGDTYRVFNSVLNTIPRFFEVYPNSAMLVQGSDSSDEFASLCKMTCHKGCISENDCKNRNRRISVYTKYVNKNFAVLTENYIFYGGYVNAHNEIEIEAYTVSKKYVIVLVIKNIL